MSYAKKVVFFPEKRMVGILFMYWYMLTLVSFDKMQNISTLMRKNLKSEGRSF